MCGRKSLNITIRLPHCCMNIKALFVSLKLYFYLPSASASATNQLARSTDTHKLRAAFSGTQLRTDAPISILRIYSPPNPGKFKEQATSNSAWLPVLNSKVPEPRPGTCHNDTATLPDSVLNFIRKHPLMDKAVDHEFGNPVFFKRDVILTKLVVDK